MKNVLKLLPLLFLLLTSCDPAHDILFKNKTASNVKIKINLEPKGRLHDLEAIADKDSIVINLAKDSIGMIYFGIGTWSTKEIDATTNSIKTIEIETNDIKTIYKSRKAVRSILDKNVKGMVFRSVIEINIE